MIRFLKIYFICLFIPFVLTGCNRNDVYIKILLSNNKLNIYKQEYDSKDNPIDIEEKGYFRFDWQKIYPKPTMSRYTTHYNSILYSMIPEKVSDEYKLNFRSGVYLVDEQNVFIGSKYGNELSYKLNNQGSAGYPIDLNELPENYKVKNILFFVHDQLESTTYKEDEDMGDAPKEEILRLYCLPINGFSRDKDNNIILIPDYENIKRQALSKNNLKTPIGTFTGILESGKYTIQDLYSDYFAEKTAEEIKPSFLDVMGITVVGITVIAVHVYLNSIGIQFE